MDLLNVRGRIYFIFDLLKYLVRKYGPNMSSARISSPLQAGRTKKYNSIQSLHWSVPPSTSISTPYVTLRQPFPLPDDKRRFGYGHGCDIVQQRRQPLPFPDNERRLRSGHGQTLSGRLVGYPIQNSLTLQNMISGISHNDVSPFSLLPTLQLAD